MSEKYLESSLDSTLTSQFYSHPSSPHTDVPRPLVDHLESVGIRSVWALADDRELPPETISVPTSPRLQTMYIAGWLHDIGKANPYFQRKLDVPEAAAADNQPPVEEMSYHSRLGGFLTFYCLKEVGVSEQNQLSGYLAVAKHHGQLPNGATYITQTTRDDTRARRELLSNGSPDQTKADLLKDGWCWAITALIDEAETQNLAAARAFIDHIITYLTDGKGSFDDFANKMQTGKLQSSLQSTATRNGMVQPKSSELPENLHDRTLAIWSGLTFADKTDVMGIDNRLLAKHLSQQEISEQIDSLGGDESSSIEAHLNGLREQARQEVVDQGVERLLDADTQIGEITLPTGLGKTLTGLEAAHKIRENRATTGSESRIIYALPFTSIIEQTRELLERSPTENDIGFGLDPFSQSYTIHHHLSETLTTHDEEEPKDVTERPAAAVAEAWRSGLTLTTFTQLFESLSGPSNSQSMKLPALSNSVIILDEPQTIPYRWWAGAARLIRLLVNEYDVTVLLMTATQPRLLDLDGGPRPVPLVESHKEYVARAQRVTYEVDESVVNYAAGQKNPLSYECASQRLTHRATNEEGSSVLAICNTISSAYELQNTVTDRESTAVNIGAKLSEIRANRSEDNEASNLDEAATLVESVVESIRSGDSEIAVGCLTARHRPIDRQTLLAAAEELATLDLPFVFVTTQLIEAGVDISFQSVYRDLAPLESIIQAAGRCNRSFEWGQQEGRVVIWQLESTTETTRKEGSETPGEVIYTRGSTSTLLQLVATKLVETAGNDLQIQETDLASGVTDEYFEEVRDGNHSSSTILNSIETAQFAALSEVNYISEDVPTEDVIVPATDTQRNRLRDCVDASTAATLDRLEEFVDYRVSVPATEKNESAIREQTASLGEDIEVRLLTNSDAYTISSGLQIQ